MNAHGLALPDLGVKPQADEQKRLQDEQAKIKWEFEVADFTFGQEDLDSAMEKVTAAAVM